MPKIPPHFTAMLQALKFREPPLEALRSLTQFEWKDLLSRWEFARLTVPLRQVCSDNVLPEWVRSQIDRNLASNRERFEHIKAVYSDLANGFGDAGAEHVVLNGFAQWPGYVQHPRFRWQSGIDLYCPPESVFPARDALSRLGYEPSNRSTYLRFDPSPAMAKKSDGERHGHLYEPDIPVSCEVHCYFWHEAAARFAPKGLDQFWSRRIERRLEDINFPALEPTDNLAYAALNLLEDLIRGKLSTYEVYELARFLHTNADNEAFWKAWRESHDDSLRCLEAISFRLAVLSFDCRTGREAEEEIHRLPGAVETWFQNFADSLFTASFRSNKDALWLHLALLESFRDRRAVLFRGLFRAPIGSAEAPDSQSIVGDEQTSPSRPLRRRSRYVAHLASRVASHASILPTTLWHGLRWWWSMKELGTQFWIYFAASFFFDFGMFIFFFLYNLYLLDSGFKENFVGLATSASAIGGMVGTIPSGIMAKRFGLRRTLVFSLAFVALVSALRVLFVSGAPQLCLSFLAGAFATIWVVCAAPALAQMTNRRNRAFAFSFVASTLIGIGVLGGLAGSRLPGWLQGFEPSATPAHLKQLALLTACGIVALAIWPASRLRFAPTPAPESKLYRSSPFLLRYLPAMGVWSLVTGAFSPFFNVYFSKHWQMPLEQIGVVYSCSQVSQVLAIFFAPAIFRKCGLVTGIVYMQIATAVALGLLAAVPGVRGAAIVYTGYTAVQWMSQPGMDTLLMGEVAPAGRSGASALNILVMSLAGAVAAAAAGASFARFGYPAVLCVTSGVALIAALMFQGLLGGAGRSTPLEWKLRSQPRSPSDSSLSAPLVDHKSDR
jgi:MFS family permease